MIEIISSDIPEFLDAAKPEDRELFCHISHLMMLSKQLATQSIMNRERIIIFTDGFLRRYDDMLDSTTSIEKINICYNYVTEFYMKLFDYLIKAEEYEMCSNFRNFIDCFNEKTIDDELEE